ncbi:DUF6286 domain-containing protein [Phytohabitans kaempferiae]|uniref:DUF6286 domain-containing protein n=1 Tax=Phytohabitans kaempferiae TaxID=1620943 RepID=A0ABV6MAI8_9ACTN
MAVVNRLASLLLGIVLLAAGLLLAIEAALLGLDRPSLWVPRDAWYARLTQTRFSDNSFLFVALVIGVVGLLVLLAQLRPRRPDRVPVGEADGWYLNRRSVEQRLAEVANRVPAVHDAHVRVRGRGRQWRAVVKAAGDRASIPDVEQAVRGELDRLAAPDTVKVGVSLARVRRVT